MAEAPGIRPLALAVVRRRDELLVFRARDPITGEIFHRPLGGAIEFGETAREALCRELREELAVELADVALLAVVENVFEFAGAPGHEIVFLFTARVADPGFSERDELGTVLDGTDPVCWLALDEVREGRAVLYPPELIDLVARGER